MDVTIWMDMDVYMCVWARQKTEFSVRVRRVCDYNYGVCGQLASIPKFKLLTKLERNDPFASTNQAVGRYLIDFCRILFLQGSSRGKYLTLKFKIHIH